MKAIFHKILSILMAFVVLFTTMSFSVDMHYCGDVLVDIAIFKDAKDCGMQMAMEEMSSSPEVKRTGCCKDKQILIKGQDELKRSFEKITFDQELFVTVFLQSHIDLFKGLEAYVVPFNGYPPPDIVIDLTILHERFLI